MKKINPAIRLMLYGVVLAGGVAVSIWAAHLGHPTAVWWWRDMLGVIQ